MSSVKSKIRMEKLKFKVAVIIPHYNDEPRLRLCLEALQQQTIESSLFHIYVVDNGSVSSPQHVIDDFSNASLLLETKPGSYSARNFALSQVQADIYAFTDSDCLPQKCWLQRAIELMAEEQVEAVSGPIELFAQNVDQPNSVELIDMCFAFPQLESITQKHYSPTANLIVKKAAFDKVGIFDSELMSGGDAEWGQRFYRADGKIHYHEEIQVLHPARDSISGYFTKIRRTTHGLWARRKVSPEARKSLTFTGLVSLIIPPFSRSKQIFVSFPNASSVTKLKASGLLYFGKLYRLYQFVLCKVGAVRQAERL